MVSASRGRDYRSSLDRLGTWGDRMSPRGGRRPGSGRKPRGYDAVRLNLHLDTELVNRIDRARRGWVSRAAFLRLGMDILMEEMEATGESATPPKGIGLKQPVPLEIPCELLSRAQALVDAGLASNIVGLVSSSGAAMVQRFTAGDRS